MILVPIQHTVKAAWSPPADTVPAGTYRFAHDDYIDRFGTLNKYGWFEKEYKTIKKSTTRVSHPLFPLADRGSQGWMTTGSTSGSTSSLLDMSLRSGGRSQSNSFDYGQRQGLAPGRPPVTPPTPSKLPPGRENEQGWAWCLDAKPEGLKRHASTPALGTEVAAIHGRPLTPSTPGSSQGGSRRLHSLK
eukprot:TRINITY_DN110848_c0_g1_i1.p1 TRINITY_DN110848_c0_g1~~TRINITY_DN110848_c0_g1_i1.p1  ORF type:complete len:189 (+),score=22.38 TRINITY_DN110848_c0_g1_i1:86-652(+)